MDLISLPQFAFKAPELKFLQKGKVFITIKKTCQFCHQVNSIGFCADFFEDRVDLSVKVIAEFAKTVIANHDLALFHSDLTLLQFFRSKFAMN